MHGDRVMPDKITSCDIFELTEHNIRCCKHSQKYQPSGKGGTRSPPATPHHLQNAKWPPGGPIMADGVWKGVYP